MKLIIDSIMEDVITITLLISSDGVLMLLNILFGTVIGTKTEGFNWKKFFFGILKAILITLGIAAFCIIIEIVPLILERVKITLPEEIVTYTQVLGVVLTWVINDILEVYEKIKSLKSLKYVTIEDVQGKLQENINNQEERG